MIETADLLLENKILQGKLAQSESEITLLKAKSESQIAFLKHQLEELRKMIFGAKSERFISAIIPQQLSLPIEKEETKIITSEETITIESHDRKKKNKKESHPLRQPFPSHLHR